jgi:hypothetical protein
MDSLEDKTLEQLIERSRDLIRQAEILKEDQENLLRQLDELRVRTQSEDGQ